MKKQNNDLYLDEKKLLKMRAALLKRLNKFVGKKYDEKTIKAIEQELIKFEFEMRFGT